MANRIYKFRAWDKEKGAMETPEKVATYLGIDANGEILVRDGGMYWNTEEAQKRYVVQMFTGLLDKNGKEIYEGDIVKYQKEYQNEIRNYIVEWCVDEFRIHCEGYGYEHGRMAHLGEIIGNIYENPELLNQ